ncbi:MAG: SDR family oxidoreductase [Actinomycetota bacterium]|nr:SDR family oxidoreductase [Actinomycetota bacterium]
MTTGRRVCLLTGASGTLGTAFCRRYADRYQLVALWHAHPPDLPSQDQTFVDPLDPSRQVAENLNPVLSLQVNLLNRRETARAVTRVLRTFGRIDVVINAAAHRQWAPLGEDTDLRRNVDCHFATNVRAPLELAIEVAHQFWQDNRESNREANRNLINLSSTAGLRVYPGYGQSLYSASKAALGFVSCHLAAEFEPLGVRVNSLAPNTFPGIVTTETVLDRMVRLDEGCMTGKILMLDADGEHWYDPANDWREPVTR